jgi:hypothetical protein
MCACVRTSPHVWCMRACVCVCLRESGVKVGRLPSPGPRIQQNQEKGAIKSRADHPYLLCLCLCLCLQDFGGKIDIKDQSHRQQQLTRENMHEALAGVREEADQAEVGVEGVEGVEGVGVLLGKGLIPDALNPCMHSSSSPLSLLPLPLFSDLACGAEGEHEGGAGQEQRQARGGRSGADGPAVGRAQRPRGRPSCDDAGEGGIGLGLGLGVRDWVAASRGRERAFAVPLAIRPHTGPHSTFPFPLYVLPLVLSF